MLKQISLVAALGLVGACATTASPPVERLARSQATVRAAEEVGAMQEPKAAYHLKLAREQLADAKRLMNAGDNENADILLQRAAADAELAMAYTKQVIAQREAAMVQKEVLSLRNER